jgi:hypothetical protein
MAFQGFAFPRFGVRPKAMPYETGKLGVEVKEAASSFEAPVPAVDDVFVRLRLDPTTRSCDDATTSTYSTVSNSDL